MRFTDVFLFGTILTMSLTASYCILIVLVLRLFLRGFPKLFSYLLWGVVLFRLLVPVAPAGPFSLLPKGLGTVAARSVGAAVEPQVWRGQNAAVEEAKDEAGKRKLAALDAGQADAAQIPLLQRLFLPSACVWLAGVFALALYSLCALLRLLRFLSAGRRRRENGGNPSAYSDAPGKQEAEEQEAGVCVIDGLPSPFVFGLFRPRIYLPASLQGEERRYVLAHERVHVARRDDLVKLLFWLAVCLHWFNPLAWLSYRLMERDMEMACDEVALRRLGGAQRKAYAGALLSLASKRQQTAGCPIAFGEHAVKERVKNILSDKKRAVFAVILAAAILFAVAAGLLMNPAGASGKQPAVTQEQLAFVGEYADAYCNRDGARMVGFFVNEETAAASLPLFEKAGDVYTFGYSSPWPGEYRFLLDEKAGGTGGSAQIWYYAWTSDPHVTVWKEEVTFEEIEGAYRVTESSMREFTEVSTAAEFDAAYRIEDVYQFTDYEEQGFAAAIAAQMAYEAENGGLDRSAVYQSPETAAAFLLNLTGGKGEIVDTASNGKATVRYTFADGGSVDIPMREAAFDGETDSGEENLVTDVIKNRQIWIPDL